MTTQDTSGHTPAPGSADTKSKPRKTLDTPHILDEIGSKVNAGGHSQSSARGPLLLLLVLVLGLGGGGAWFAHQQRLASESYDRLLSLLQDENIALRQQVAQARAAMEAEFEEQISRLQQQESVLGDALQTVESTSQRDEQRVSRLQQQVNRDMQDIAGLVTALQGQVAGLQQRDLRWLNAEAEYLMRLAQRKLNVEADVASTLLLLNTVLSLLTGQDSLLATTAAQNIQQDIDILQALRLPNRVAIAEQLVQLSARLEQLSFASSMQANYVDAVQQRLQPDNRAAAAELSWRQSILDLLRTVFVWRDVERSGLVLLQPDQELLLKQQMYLQVEQARLAVVQGEQNLYDLALQQLAAALGRFTGTEHPRAQALLAEITTLRATPITAELPDLSASGSLVRQLAGSTAQRQE
jgi:uroporphyrin-3 C-methyltransferase